MKNLIVFRGPTGVGKTTLANALAKELQVPGIDKDDIKDIIDASFTDSGVAGELSYDAMWRIAGRQLLNGLCVICDSPLGMGALSYRRALETAARFQAKLTIVDCVCSEEDR